MDTKPQFVSGIINAAGQAICWKCMTLAEYEADISSPIFFDTESDMREYCHRCDSKIDHKLTEDGLRYELSEDRDESCYVVTGSLPGCLPDYSAQYATEAEAIEAIEYQFNDYEEALAEFEAEFGRGFMDELTVNRPEWIEEGKSFRVGMLTYEIDYHYAAN